MKTKVDKIVSSIKKGSVIKILDSVTRKLYRFEQIAGISYNGKAYCILRPIDKIILLDSNDGVVYRVDEEYNLEAETDEDIILHVFERYLNQLRKKIGG